MLALQYEKGAKVKILSRQVRNGDIEALRDPSVLFSYYGADPSKAKLLLVPCGQCDECRMKRSQETANRIYLETLSYNDNWGVCLTYDDDHLPLGKEVTTDDGEICFHPTLDPDHLTAFMKALRQIFARRYGFTGIKFYAAGEYGSQNYRPHFHLVLMNCPLPADDVFICKGEFSKTGEQLYGSRICEEAWSNVVKHIVKVGKRGKVLKNPKVLKERVLKGRVRLNPVTWKYAAYCARYILKKQVGKNSSIYDRLGIVPEFTRCSTQEAIGKNFYEENKEKILENDSFLVKQGERVVSASLPSYFLKLAVKDGYDIEGLKERRRALAAAHLDSTMSNISQDYGDYLRELEKEKKNKLKALPRSDF